VGGWCSRLPGWEPSKKTNLMSGWSDRELATIRTADEIHIALTAPTKRPAQLWVVHVGDNLYVRSYRGPRAAGIAAAGAMAVDGSAQRTCHGRLAFKRCSDIRRAPRCKYDGNRGFGHG
jgi:hypothetical protein